jgi:TolB-like protein/Tfp pilus assembly protein PilF
MADLFVSYARADRARVTPLIAALEGEGWSVWWDPEIAPGQEFDRLIADELEKARAVIVVWTPGSVTSRWVRGEARVAADRGVRAPVRFEAAQLPIDLRAIHTTDLDDWAEDAKAPTFQELVRAVRALLGEGAADAPAGTHARARGAKHSICVLPFSNISGDPEQEYFSDGISEDIITDLSKVSALQVASRNTAFTFKGRRIGIPQVARQLGVSHVLEGSVRKAGNRVRISAQLIEAGSDSHIWAERYDRDLTDIFAVQDEISRAIVDALKIRLAPEEKKAIAHRSTTNPEAYQLYLMARKYWLGGWQRRRELILRLCRRALDLDPAYARAWALTSICQADLRFGAHDTDDQGWAAAERALSLDPDLAEAHGAKGRILEARGQHEAAQAEHEIALRLDPESYEVNAGAARWAIATRQFELAIRFLEAASAINDDDYWAPGMLIQCYEAKGDTVRAREVAAVSMERIEKLLVIEPDNGGALGFAVNALICLGKAERAKARAEDALLLDPDNSQLTYNLACAMSKAGETDFALELLGRAIERVGEEGYLWAKVDTDLDPVREEPRFKAIMAAADARLVKAAPSGAELPAA